MAAFSLLAGLSPAARLLAQQGVAAGANVNMVGGPATITTGPGFRIEGDPFLQRQNEPSMACSSRNPLTCLAGANDYRLVDVPGLPDGKVTGDAWLGVFWTRDDGQTWRSTAMPGFPQDTSALGLASPIKGYAAAADPTVRAGTNGLLYYSGIAFNPAASTTAGSSSSGAEGKAGTYFLTLFIDDNNSQDVTAPPRYVRTTIIDDGTSGQFLDKPWIATDIPRQGAGTCLIPGSNGVPDQRVPAGPLYAAFSVFTGSGNNANSKLMFTRSLDCGVTFEKPVRLDASVDISQSAMISVNPTNGDILVAWRSFATPNGSATAKILVARSTNGGRSFAPPVTLVDLGVQSNTLAFDQPTLPDASVPDGTLYRLFRTNGYPSMCTDTNGLTRVAWAQRGIGPNGDARIMVSTSTGGATWSAPVAADNHPGRGHQFMPTMACSATHAMLAWYDARNDNAQYGGYPVNVIFSSFIWEPVTREWTHTLDVRGAMASSGGAFGPSTQISRYQYALDASAQFVQLEFNPANWPLFGGGRLPFLGDYIDMTPSKVFTPPLGGSGWTYNTDATEPPVFHAAWTDNRDIVPSLGDLWGSWGPAGTAACVQPSIRNQNIYTSRLTRGLVVGTGGNSRLAGSLTRAYAIVAQNTTGQQRTFRFVAGQAPGGPASFKATEALTQLDVQIPAYSAAVRTAFVSGTTAAIVRVFEIDAAGSAVAGGLQASTVINSDNTAPPPADASVVAGETHSVALSDAFVDSYINPTFLNPTFLNPTFLNPTFLNPTFLNPTFLNPTFLNPTFLNPTFLNPTFLNPTFLNPTFLNPTFLNSPPETVTDLSWQVTNEGNVVSGYNFNAILASVPTDALFQLIVNRVYNTPGAQDCTLGNQVNASQLLNIGDPSLTRQDRLSPSASNATFALAPSDTAVVTLRILHNSTFTPNPDDITIVLTAQAADPPGTVPTVIRDKVPPVITVAQNVTVVAVDPQGQVVDYQIPTAFDGLDGDLPVTCTPPPGSTFPVGDTEVTCTATDAHGNVGTSKFIVRVIDTAPTIAPMADVTAEATSAAGAAVTYTAPATTDGIDGAGVATCAPASGATFPLGATTVTCTATDSAGNAATPVTFTVTVRDTTAPVITVPGNVTASATTTTGADVTFAASATDAVDADVPVTCTPASGSTFPIGPTTVNCSAADDAGNSASASFTVTVRDSTAPSISIAADITAEATSAAGAVVTYSVTASDTTDGAVPVTCSPASGSTFPLGATAVNCSATDSSGNSASASFTVTVADRTAPTLTVPGSLLAEATGPSGRAVTYAVTAVDAADSSVALSCAPASGSTFPLGTTSVGCTATDDSGNTSAAGFTVTVVDTTPPALSLPAPISVMATSSAGAVVTWTASATDLVSGAAPVTCAPASGSLFAAGTTSVACSATDALGNTAAGAFTVTVAPLATPYGFINVQNLPPSSPTKTFKPGSSVPLAWRFTLGGVAVNSADALPEVRITGPSGTLVLTPEDPGASSFQPPTAANGWTWQFNWQTKNLKPGTYSVWIGSRKTGQTYAYGTAFGPFSVVLK